MKIGIITNFSKKSASALFMEATKILLSGGVKIFAPKNSNKVQNVTYLEENELFEVCDIIIVIGGDGTIIHNAKRAAMLGKSVLGINAGRVGFLAGLEDSELSKLSTLISGEYSTEKRMLLKVRYKNFEYYCLNDAVISKGNLSRMIDISASINGECISYRADGLIAATPTGSTAYSLSAGGPIVDFRLESISRTPICPQSLYTRPILVSSENNIEVSALAPKGTDVYLTVDGEQSILVEPNETIEITKEENFFVRLIKLNDGSFLTALSEKFNLLG